MIFKSVLAVIKEKTAIKSEAFKDCISLKKITVETGTVIESGAFENTGLKFVEIPKGCKVDRKAFPAGCKFDKDVYLKADADFKNFYEEREFHFYLKSYYLYILSLLETTSTENGISG